MARNIRWLAISAFSLLAVFSARGVSGQPVAECRVLARVAGETITSVQVDAMVQLEMERLGLVSEADASTLRLEIARSLVERELIYAEWQDRSRRMAAANPEEKLQVPAELLQERLDDRIRRSFDGDREKFMAAITRAGLSYTEYMDRLKKEVAVDLLRASFTRGATTPTPAEVRAHFEANKERFTPPESVHLRVIRLPEGTTDGVSAEERMRELVAQLDATAVVGASDRGSEEVFIRLATENSPASEAKQGGDMGTHPVNKLERGLAQAIAGLQSGQYLREPYRANGSLYLVYVVNRESGGVPELTGAVRETVQQDLVLRRQLETYRSFIAELKRRYPVRVYDAELKQVMEQG